MNIQNKSLRHLGKLKLHPGQRLFELNTKTMFIQAIDFTEVTLDRFGAVHKKFTIKENCFYVRALNLKNAEKKFLKMFK